MISLLCHESVELLEEGVRVRTDDGAQFLWLVRKQDWDRSAETILPVEELCGDRPYSQDV